MEYTEEYFNEMDKKLGPNKRFSMFTYGGNIKVFELVEKAKSYRWSWKKVQQELHNLSRSNLEMYGEATDTAVREHVGVVLGFLK